jgi:hypothetical protein
LGDGKPEKTYRHGDASARPEQTCRDGGLRV